MDAFLWSQVLAGMTLITGMTAFQFRERVTMLRTWALGASFAAVHFFLLGSFEAGILVAVTALRFVVSSFTTDWRMMWLFLTLSVAGFAFTYAGPASLLPLFATLVGTVGSFHGTGNAVRYSAMVAEGTWIIFDIIIWSPVAIVMEVLFFTSNLIGLIRHLDDEALGRNMQCPVRVKLGERKRQQPDGTDHALLLRRVEAFGGIKYDGRRGTFRLIWAQLPVNLAIHVVAVAFGSGRTATVGEIEVIGTLHFA